MGALIFIIATVAVILFIGAYIDSVAFIFCVLTASGCFLGATVGAHWSMEPLEWVARFFLLMGSVVFFSLTYLNMSKQAKKVLRSDYTAIFKFIKVMRKNLSAKLKHFKKPPTSGRGHW